jgi:elongation factor P
VIASGDLKKGVRIELEGAPWVVESVATQSASGRASNTLVKVRLRNVLTGQVSDRSLKAGDKYPEPDLHNRDAQFLYTVRDTERSTHHFMDTATFEQFELSDLEVGDDARLLLENLEVRAIEYRGRIVGIALPAYIEMKIVEVEPGARGDTATGGVTTAAVTENGLPIQVPLFVKVGDRVRIDTATQQFKDRVAR